MCLRSKVKSNRNITPSSGSMSVATSLVLREAVTTPPAVALYGLVVSKKDQGLVDVPSRNPFCLYAHQGPFLRAANTECSFLLPTIRVRLWVRRLFYNVKIVEIVVTTLKVREGTHLRY